MNFHSDISVYQPRSRGAYRGQNRGNNNYSPSPNMAHIRMQQVIHYDHIHNTDPRTKDSHRGQSGDYSPSPRPRFTSIDRNDDAIKYENAGTGEESDCQIVVVNVSGLRFATRARVFDRLPDTLLGNLEKRKELYDPVTREIFFDRHRPSFEAIFDYYLRGGRLKCPYQVPLDVFLEEVDFFGLSGHPVEDNPHLSTSAEAEPKHPLKKKIWHVLEKPAESLVGRAIGAFIVAVVLLSTISFCVETIPMSEPVSEPRHEVVDPNSTENDSASQNPKKTEFNYFLIAYTHFAFFWIETVCIAIFTAEFTARYAVTPKTTEKFLKNMTNIIDMVAIIPYFLTLITIGLADGMATTYTQGTVHVFLRIFRLLRVVRVFKLSRHSKGLRILGKTLRASMNEFVILSFFMIVAMVFFSSVMYVTEAHHPRTNYTSIPDGFWWAVVTMTTVGYGDNTPLTVGGKIVGAVCAVTGLLVIALPVPVIVSNFNYFYRTERGIIGPNNQRAVGAKKDKKKKKCCISCHT
ncbi:PREDICTED: potassium voltage-gated channel subfamily A member 7-like isoform X1 [Branchiostoma belcheri]|uniref:Potassium voltage-gated channel subfamily A member 7-like isoform X1 n=2 Tax=Branchiostoma belcheri TaxID=7741 RepID=A0A6P5AEJ2_BRABE|nr:PREDICTED: potassium voltage-gated channel subfamily A member 7-like isoform X1 [Branchiostoma belcheri]